MYVPTSARRPTVRAALVCLAAGGLGACHFGPAAGGDSGGAGAPVLRAATPPAPAAPAAFRPVSGPVESRMVVTEAVTNIFTHDTSFRIVTEDTPRPHRADVRQPTNPTETASANVSGLGMTFYTSGVTIESNGAAVRGAAVNSTNMWAVYTNTPGSRLNASLGSPSLDHSYTGLATTPWQRAGTTGGQGFNMAGLYGGNRTSDMPTSGQATYAGGFEGIEHSTNGGGAMETSSVSGRFNMTADFAARTVRGRIDDVTNHSRGPIGQPSGYSIAIDGRITNSDFAGSGWLTQSNSDMPMSGFTQNGGRVHGGFFGPGAAEAAGALGVTAAGETSQRLVTGGFGAKKN